MRKLMIPIVAVLLAGCGSSKGSDKGFDPNDIQSMISALDSDDMFTQQRAAIALGNKGEEAKAAAPALAKLLKDENADMQVRRDAAEALGKIGSTDQQVIDTLKEMSAYRKDRLVRDNSKAALAKLQP